MPLLSFPQPQTTGTSDLVLFTNFYNNLIQGTLYRQYKTANPVEAQKWQTYATAIINGQSPATPTMATLTGKALVFAGQMVTNKLSLEPPKRKKFLGIF